MNLDTALEQLARDPNPPLDLAELALCLARDEYPDLDVEAYLAEIDGMAHEARRYLRGGLEAQVTGLCRYLFHDMGFRGKVDDRVHPLVQGRADGLAIGNVAIGISAVGYLATFFPFLSATPIATCLTVIALLWLTTVANFGGPSVTGRIGDRQSQPARVQPVREFYWPCSNGGGGTGHSAWPSRLGRALQSGHDRRPGDARFHGRPYQHRGSD